MTKAGFPQQRRSFMTHRRLSIGAVDLLRKKSFMSALTKSDAGQDDFFLKKMMRFRIFSVILTPHK